MLEELYDKFLILMPSLTAVASLICSLLVSIKNMKAIKSDSQVEIRKIAKNMLSSNNGILEDNEKLRESIRSMIRANSDLQKSLNNVNTEVAKIQAEIERQKLEAEAELEKKEAEQQALEEAEQKKVEEDETKQIYEKELR